MWREKFERWREGRGWQWELRLEAARLRLCAVQEARYGGRWRVCAEHRFDAAVVNTTAWRERLAVVLDGIDMSAARLLSVRLGSSLAPALAIDHGPQTLPREVAQAWVRRRLEDVWGAQASAWHVLSGEGPRQGRVLVFACAADLLAMLGQESQRRGWLLQSVQPALMKTLRRATVGAGAAVLGPRASGWVVDAEGDRLAAARLLDGRLHHVALLPLLSLSSELRVHAESPPIVGQMVRTLHAMDRRLGLPDAEALIQVLEEAIPFSAAEEYEGCRCMTLAWQTGARLSQLVEAQPLVES